MYVGSLDHNVYALNASTGTKLWRHSIGAFVASSPALANGVVYIDGGYNVYALNARTGAKLWSHSTHGNLCSGSSNVFHKPNSLKRIG